MLPGNVKNIYAITAADDDYTVSFQSRLWLLCGMGLKIVRQVIMTDADVGGHMCVAYYGDRSISPAAAVRWQETLHICLNARGNALCM